MGVLISSTGRQLAILDARAVVKANTYRPATQQMNFLYLLDVCERPQVTPRTTRVTDSSTARPLGYADT